LPQPRHAPSLVLLAAVLCALVLAPADALARRIELPNGDVYEGDIEDGFRTGEGVYVWADGHRYEGEFLNNRMHGQGVYHWPDGRTYRGDFVNDRREGQGVLRWPNGDTYNGEFQDNQMHGQGTFRWANGDVYTGQFAEGVPQGRGVYRFADGRTLRGSYTGWESGSGTLREDGVERRCELRDGLLYCEAPPEKEQPAAEPKSEEGDATSSEEQSLAPAETPVRICGRYSGMALAM